MTMIDLSPLAPNALEQRPILPTDPAPMTPDEWEEMRWRRVGLTPPKHSKRGRPANAEIFRNGKSPRPRREVDGVTLWACNDAGHKGRRWLPASEFYRRLSAPEGLQPKCKACARRICAERTERLRAARAAGGEDTREL